MARPALLLLAVTVTTAAQVTLPAREKLHIFVLMGQSNMCGHGGTIEAQDITDHPRLYAYEPLRQANGNWLVSFTRNYEGSWAYAHEPVVKSPWNAMATVGDGDVSPGTSFGRTLLASLSDTAAAVGLLGLAVSGSAIESWVKGGEYYADNISMMQKVGQQGTIKGILWHQGEANSGPMDPSYGQVFAQMITDYRTDLGMPDIAVVAGMVGTDGSLSSRVNFAHDSLEHAGFPLFGVSSSAGLSLADHVHYDGPSMREWGRRYEATYLEILAEQQVGTRYHRGLVVRQQAAASTAVHTPARTSLLGRATAEVVAPAAFLGSSRLLIAYTPGR